MNDEPQWFKVSASIRCHPDNAQALGKQVLAGIIEAHPQFRVDGLVDGIIVTPENRWAPFTNDELDTLTGALDLWIEPQPMDENPSYNPRDFDAARGILAEAEAELERRRNP